MLLKTRNMVTVPDFVALETENAEAQAAVLL